MVTLTVDERRLEATEGATLLQVARQNGIEIPTLCHHEALTPYGACRLCTVEITRGRKSRLTTACTYPVEEGLIVQTASPRVVEARKMIMELLLARCPNVPMVRDLAAQVGVTASRFKQADDDCILCGLCVRVCDEVVGAKAISFVNRGVDREVSTPFGTISEACIACGACAVVCPTGAIKIENEEMEVQKALLLGPNRAIYVPFLQVVPNVPIIDRESCIHFRMGGCDVCEKYCEPGAINHEMEPEILELDVGAVILATGFDLFDAAKAKQYGYGVLDNVLSSLEFERLSHASGPTGGKILLKDGTPPKSVAILHCIGSRDENYNEYCSRVCCMYSMKFAHLVREKIQAQVHEFYIDIRAYGKGYEEFYKRLLHEDVIFVRGKGAEVSNLAETPEERGKLIVKCEDTLLGVVRRVPVDMVILATGLEAAKGAAELARVFSISRSKDGFFLEKHPKLAPVETASDGILIAGACQGPKDIPDSVAQGGAAAAVALSMLDRGKVEIEPIVSCIDPDACAGCKICIATCPVNVIHFDEERKISVVEEATCKGCGTCVAACPSGAATQKGFSDEQIFAEIEGSLLLVK